MRRYILIIAACFVIGSYNSASGMIEVSLPDTTALAGTNILIPIYARNISLADSIIAYQFAVSFDHEVLMATGAKNQGTITASWGAPLVNLQQQGAIIVGSYSAYPIATEGVLVYLKFLVSGTVTDTTSLKFMSFFLNGNNTQLTTNDGLFTVDGSLSKISIRDNVGGRVHISFDGLLKDVPFDTIVETNSEHYMDIVSQQSGHSGIQYLFHEWSNGANQQHILSPGTDTVVTAIMNKQCYLDALSNPLNIVSIAGTGWHDANTNVELTAPTLVHQGDYNFKFKLWQIDETPNVNNPLVVNMDSAHQVIACYVKVFSISGKIQLSGEMLGGTELVLTGSKSDTTFTDSQGFFKFDNVESAHYLLYPFRMGIQFDPTYKEYITVQSDLFDQNFNATDTLKPEVTIVHPNGGEILKNASPDTIRWIATDNISIDYTNIHYSTDNGQHWKLITGGRTSELHYVWTTPDTPSDSIRIKVTVTDKAGNMSFDISDECFKIIHTSVVSCHDDIAPLTFALLSNYPNPFNNQTIFTYQLPQNAYTTVRIFNINGQEIITIINEDKKAGVYQVSWDGRDKNGNIVGSGLYLYRLESAGMSATKSMVFLK